jgi:hypothetical protein
VHPRVIATLPNVLGDLLAWGRDGDGWWGLVIWTHRVMDRHQLGGDVRYSAWMPASTLHRSRYDTVDYRGVVRLDLPADRCAWPSPSDRHDVDCEHLGVMTESTAG